MMSEIIAEIIEKQSSVISIQASVIKDLFTLLGQYMTAEELDALPENNRINMAAQIAESFMP